MNLNEIEQMLMNDVLSLTKKGSEHIFKLNADVFETLLCFQIILDANGESDIAEYLTDQLEKEYFDDTNLWIKENAQTVEDVLALYGL